MPEGKASFGQRLRYERQKRRLSQEELAEALQTTKLSIIRWEKDQVQPRPFMERQIYEFFAKTAETFGVSSVKPVIWNVPFERNPYFRGRDDILAALHKALVNGGSIAITQHALSGLGGIGKTQTAVEYAYRFVQAYRAVLWVRADSPELLTSDFAALTHLLDLREKTATHQLQAIQAVKAWLQAQSGWLLIFDNVEDMRLLRDFLPSQFSGSVLITTREQVRRKSIRKLDVEKLNSRESLLLLLQRARFIEDESQLVSLVEGERLAAEQLCEALDGLPLALDQAAAYIEENQCSIGSYLSRFLRYRSSLLAWRSEQQDYPYSVAATWALSFKKIEEAHPASADLLYACAFLHPDTIPEELFSDGAACLGPHLQRIAGDALALDAAIRPLFSFSLIKRDRAKNTLIIHRLVQAVLQDRMSEDLYQEWVERVVRAINILFPVVEFSQWSLCERYLPHAQICATFIEQKHIAIPETVALLNRVGCYLRERARYNEALPILKLASTISEQLFGPQHLKTVEVLHNLAATYRDVCDHDAAKPLYERVLAIREQLLGLQHPATAATLDELGNLHHQLSAYSLAEQYYQQACEIYEQTLGGEDPETLRSFNNLAALYFAEGKFAEAEHLWRRILAVREQTLGAEHPDTARIVHNLALLSARQNRHAEAEQLYLRALSVLERELGAYHRYIATTLHNIASLYKAQGRYAEAELFWRRALSIRKYFFFIDPPATEKILGLLRELYEEQGLSLEIEHLTLEDTAATS